MSSISKIRKQIRGKKQHSKKVEDDQRKKAMRRGARPVVSQPPKPVSKRSSLRGKIRLLGELGEVKESGSLPQQIKHLEERISKLNECEVLYDLVPWSGQRVKSMWVHSSSDSLVLLASTTIDGVVYHKPSVKLYDLLCSSASRKQVGDKLIFPRLGITLHIIYELHNGSYLKQDETLYSKELRYKQERAKTNEMLMREILENKPNEKDRQLVQKEIQNIVGDNEYAEELEKVLYNDEDSIGVYTKKASNFLVWILPPVSELNSLFLIRLKMQLLDPTIAVELASELGEETIEHSVVPSQIDDVMDSVRQRRIQIEEQLQNDFFRSRYPYQKKGTKDQVIHISVPTYRCDSNIDEKDRIFFQGHCFSINELDFNFMMGNYNNPITDLPFPPKFIQQITGLGNLNPELPEAAQVEQTDNTFLKLVLKELTRLEEGDQRQEVRESSVERMSYKSKQSCYHCKSDSVAFKTFKDSEMLGFCSPDCLESVVI